MKCEKHNCDLELRYENANGEPNSETYVCPHGDTIVSICNHERPFEKCKKCSFPLKDHWSFCPNCGLAKKILEVVKRRRTCKWCGTGMADNFKYCWRCGTAW